MPSDETEKDAADQFPVVDPELIREALCVSKLGPNFRPGATAAVTVELTKSQVNFLMFRARHRKRNLDGDAALKHEIEELISADVTEGMRRLQGAVQPWLGMIWAAKRGPRRHSLRDMILRHFKG